MHHVLLVKVGWREGRALGSEEGRALGSEICYEQRKEVELGLYCIQSNFIITFVGALESNFE
jgi:hypothetical protein